MAISSAWIKNLRDPEKQKDFETTLRNSTYILNRLKEILEEKEREMTNTECSIKDFDNPSWANKQAFRNGKRSTIKEVLDLLDFN